MIQPKCLVNALIVAVLVACVGSTIAAQGTKPIQEAQQRLKDLGYDPGPPDGALGARTIAAIKKFQSDQSLPITGTVDPKTLAALASSKSAAVVAPSKSVGAAAPKTAPPDFSPVSDVMSQLGLFASVASRSQAVMTSDKDHLWSFDLSKDTDVVEYSRSADGIGDPTGSMTYAAQEGGMDPASPPMRLPDGTYRNMQGKSVMIKYHRQGRSYTRLDPKLAANIGPVPPWELNHYIGTGSTIRFASEAWVWLGNIQYRNGGFTVGREGLTFLAGTEVLTAVGTFRFEGGKWLEFKPE